MTRQSRPGPVFAIAIGAGIASFAMNFWIPFLPLFAKELGATSDANALFWVGLATAGLGMGRLVSGPFWGILSDRYGRRLMFIRALVFASGTTAIAALATEPWHLAVAFACQGLFSGFIPAAVALTSVTVSDERLNPALGLVTGAQYLGTTVGPAVGAALVIVLSMRGAIIAAAIMPVLAAILVIFLVPRDEVRRKSPPVAVAEDDGEGESETSRGVSEPATVSFWRLIGPQFFLALFFYFFLFGTTQLIRLATPLALADLEVGGDVEGLVGVAFTLAGVASMVGVIYFGRKYFTPGRFRLMLGLGCAATAGAHVLLAASPGVVTFIACFSLISLLQAAMLPASNTLIASNVPRERRGTAFGIAGSAQALAFIVGPMAAAWFAAISMTLGWLVLGVLFLLVGALLMVWLREPALDARQSPA
ncbi:MAG: MFS transporter [Dehalococcoidia bacterium]